MCCVFGLRLKFRSTYIASAAPARVLEIEKCLSPIKPPKVAGARLDAFKHENLGLDAQLLNDAVDTSTEAAARTALCALIVVGLIGGYFDDQSIFNFFCRSSTSNYCRPPYLHMTSRHDFDKHHVA